jgi:hypothetical protein
LAISPAIRLSIWDKLVLESATDSGLAEGSWASAV